MLHCFDISHFILCVLCALCGSQKKFIWNFNEPRRREGHKGREEKGEGRVNAECTI